MVWTLALELGHVDQAYLVAERLRRRRSDTALALERLARGEYGRCTACGGTIPAARLRARPEATTCVACQAALEQAAARGGERRLGEPAGPPLRES